jgi:hypothetical protein
VRGKRGTPLDDLQENLQTWFKRLIPVPTDAIPGTEEKILVLRGRAERGEELWHPLDGPGGRLVETGRGPDLRRVRGRVKTEDGR